MIWLYLSWLVVLVGASIAYYHQNPNNLYSLKSEMRISNRMREKMGLMICYLVGRSLYKDSEPWTLNRLTLRLKCPMAGVERIVGFLEDGGLLAESNDTPAHYLPAKPFDTVTVLEVLNAVRRAGEDRNMEFQRLPKNEAVDGIFDVAEKAISQELDKVTMKDLVLKD